MPGGSHHLVASAAANLWSTPAVVFAVVASVGVWLQSLPVPSELPPVSSESSPPPSPATSAEPTTRWLALLGFLGLCRVAWVWFRKDGEAASEEEEALCREMLRFKIGASVLCRTGRDEWSPGTVVAVWYRERDWPAGDVVPYQVELLDGTLIWVPEDSPRFCQKVKAPSWRKAVAEQDLQLLEVAVSLHGCEETDHVGRSPLLSCVEIGWQEGALCLLALKADPCKCAGPEKSAAIHLAILKGTAVHAEGLPNTASTVSLVNSLLEAHANVNAQNEDPDNDLDNFTSTTYKGLEQRQHRSALHYAAEAGEIELCGTLIAARAIVDLEDRFKMTPLDLALEAGSQLVSDVLLRSAADPNRGNMSRGLQQTTLHQMSNSGNAELLGLLLKHKANVNAFGKQGMTPLHLAARKKHIEVVKMLLEARADVCSLDENGRTPRQYALSNQDSALGEALTLDNKLQVFDRIALLDSALNDKAKQHMDDDKR